MIIKYPDIRIFKDVNFIELKKLCLCQNKMENIDIFGKCNFPKLKYLYLLCNSISHVDISDEIHFDDVPKIYISKYSCNGLENIKNKVEIVYGNL